jgi:plastocyanin
MKRIGILVGSALALFAASAHATNFTVIARPNFTFDPSTLQINVGDTVTFENDPTNPGFHNVTSDTTSVTAFRCANGCDGDGGNGNPSGATWTATVTFPTAGTAPFHCEIHGGEGGVGMSGVITVGTFPVVGVDPPSLTGTASEGASTSVPLSISNAGNSDLVWTADTASATCATPDTVPWLSISPDNGTVASGDPPASVDVTLDATALTAGVYDANVCVHSNDAASDPVSVPVEFTVQGVPAINVDPTSLSGSAAAGASTTLPLAIGNTGDADLTWTADTASTTCATPDLVPWLSIAPNTGTVVMGDPPASVNVTLDATSLTPGVYNANVCVHSNDAASDPVSVPVEFTVDVNSDQIFANGFDP